MVAAMAASSSRRMVTAPKVTSATSAQPTAARSTERSCSILARSDRKVPWMTASALCPAARCVAVGPQLYAVQSPWVTQLRGTGSRPGKAPPRCAVRRPLPGGYLPVLVDHAAVEPDTDIGGHQQ